MTPSTTDEGLSTSFSVSSTFYDPAVIADTYVCQVNWGDATFSTGIVSGFSCALTDNHAYADNGTYNVSVSVTDSDNAMGTSPSTLVTVNNLAPTGMLSNGGPVNEGATTSVSFSGQTDPSSADTTAGFKYSYDFDNDGTFEVTDSSSASAIVPASYLADGPGSRTVAGRY